MVGDYVTGRDVKGNSFSGTVTDVPSPYTVILDHLYATPIGLLDKGDE
jgi:hypothetical protein